MTSLHDRNKLKGAEYSVVIDAQKPHRGASLREIWNFRDLLWLLAKRDITVRYRQTVLGVLWAVLQPLGMVLIFSVVFGRLAKMPSDGVSYTLFAFAGLLPWQFFSTSITAAGMSVVNSRNLVTKVYFPRSIVPIAAMGAPFLDLLVATSMMIAMMLWHGKPLLISLLWWLPLFFIVTAAAAIGVGSFIAALNVAYRDFRNMMSFLTTIWMFLTPVIYPPSLVPERYKFLLNLNPMTGIVGGLRSVWFGMPFDLPSIATSCAVSVLMLWGGLSYFRATERRIADII